MRMRLGTSEGIIRLSISVAMIVSLLSFVATPAKAIPALPACTPEISTSGGYTILKFIDLGECTWTSPSGTTMLQGLILGGGGGGGANTHMGGGGGGGGYLSFETLTVTNQVLKIKVGAGGVGGASTLGGAFPENGETSSVIIGSDSSPTLRLVAPGGGSGGSDLGDRNPGREYLAKSGGSGGGSGGGFFPAKNPGRSESVTAILPDTQTAVTIGLLQLGNDGSLCDLSPYGGRGGGGGGAGAPGGCYVDTANGATENAGHGGNGYPNNILGTQYFWAGGGGGGHFGYQTNIYGAGNGGLGGGGGGGAFGEAVSPQPRQGSGGVGGLNAPSLAIDGAGGNGGVNTGGGGGAGIHPWGLGGNGGSGIVLLKYVSTDPSWLAVTRSSSGVKRLQAFTTQPQITFQSGVNDETDTAKSSVIVTATISSGGTIISGDTATAIAGVANFSNLRIDGTTGATYRITYSSPGSTSVTETLTLSGLLVTRQSAGVNRFEVFSTQPQITYKSDGTNSGETSTTSFMVTATISAGATIVGGDTATASAGVATFSNLRIDGIVGSTYTITYSSASKTLATESVTLGGTDTPLYDGTSGIVPCGRSGYLTITSNTLVGGYWCVGSASIPSGVTAIGDGALNEDSGYSAASASQITSLTIPDSVTYFGWASFARTDAMTSLSLGNGITSIAEYSFSNITSLTSLVIPANVTTINQGNFSFAQNLTSLTMPSGITSIHSNSFSQIQSGTPFIYCGTMSITFPGSVVLTPTCPDGTPATAISTQPSGATNGSSLTTQPIIRIVDSATSTITSSTLKVVASIQSGTGTLSGTTSVAAVNGVATFTNLAITGTPGPFTLAFTPVGVSIPVTSNTFTVATGAALTPTFGSPTVTADGFSVQISNYDNAFTWAGTATASGSVAIDGSGLVNVTGVAPGTSSTATITTTRAGYSGGSATVSASSISNVATLSALTLSSGTLSPTFTSSTTSYTATVANNISSITVTPTRTQGNATITVDGSSVASGVASGSVSLTEGANTITVVGTAQDGATTATYTITVTRAAPTPTITIGTTNFRARTATNVGVTLSGFDATLSYQATVKFVNATTNADVSNGILTATSSGTSTIPGYTSYSDSKLGFKGTYSQIATALASMTWNPLNGSTGMSMRIGIASMPGTTEFYYDANSGHYYKYVSTALRWESATAAAEATILFGLRGYLTEVNSAAENSFIGRETTARNVWIGASDRTTEGTWIWAGATDRYAKPIGSGSNSGRSAAFHSWASREPNDWPWYGPGLPEREDCAVTNWQGAIGMWNDWPCMIPQPYLIEFGGRPGEISTAIGATLTSTVDALPPVQYTITYDPAGGDTTPTSPTRVTGERFALAGAIAKAPAGGITYRFAGWKTGSTIYKAGETATVGSANLAFTAEWIVQYEVTYLTNGGSFAVGDTDRDSECTLVSSRRVCNDSQSITVNSAPTKSGYDFDGWKDSAGNLIADTDAGTAGIQTTINDSRYIFTASWTPITYTITYISSGSSAPTQSALEEGDTFTVGTAGTRSGFRFDGWSDGASIYLPDTEFTVGTSIITLTAQWTAVFTVTYSPGLGSGTPSADTASYPGSYALIVATDAGISRSGFTFSGWSDGTASYQIGDIFTIGTSDITFTALWTVVPIAPTPTPAPTPTLTPKIEVPATIQTAATLALKAAREALQVDVAKNQKTYQGMFASLTSLDASISYLIPHQKSGAMINPKTEGINSSQSANLKISAKNISLFGKALEELKDRVSIRVTATGISVTPVNGFTGVVIVPVVGTVDGVESVVLNKVVINPVPPKAQSFAPTEINKSSITWAVSTSQTTGYRVTVNGKEICQTTATTCPVAALIGPKSVVAITALGNDQTVSASVVIPYVATRPIPALKVNFAVGSSILSTAQKNEIRSVARVIETQGFTRLVVSGFTDSSGSLGLNRKLSEARAKSVAAFMRTLLPTIAIKASAFGPKKPLASNASLSGKAQNRRTEIATW